MIILIELNEHHKTMILWKIKEDFIMENLKKIKDVEKLCKVEQFILSNGRAIMENDYEILHLAEDIMQDYTYGWYIYEESLPEQLISINKFKIYILGLIKTA
jgi:hypothetical protein